MDLDEEARAKIRIQTQSDGEIFAEEDSDCIGEVPVRTKVIKLYKYCLLNNFRIDTIVEI